MRDPYAITVYVIAVLGMLLTFIFFLIDHGLVP